MKRLALAFALALAGCRERRCLDLRPDVCHTKVCTYWGEGADPAVCASWRTEVRPCDRCVTWEK